MKQKQVLFTALAVFFALQIAVLMSCSGSGDSEESDDWTPSNPYVPSTPQYDENITLTIKSNYPDKNKGDETKTATYTTTYTLKDKPFSCFPYIFIGYSQSATGEVSYEAGNIYDKKINSTLYAVWGEKIDIRIIFDANSDTETETQLSQNVTLVKNLNTNKFAGTYSLLSYTKANSVQLDKLDWTSDTKILLGFSTNKHNTKATCSNGALLSIDTIKNSMTSDYEENVLTLYAIWANKSDCLKITFDGNGGQNDDFATQTAQYILKDYYQTSGTLDLNPFSRKNYLFAGWALDKTATVATYKDGATYSSYNTTNVTLYAVWQHDTSKEIFITFNGNGGTATTMLGEVSLIKQTVSVNNNDAKLEKNKFIRQGYVFAGWSTSSYSYNQVVSYKDEAAIDFSKDDFKKDTILYAVWKVAITITFNGNGGKTSNNTTVVTQNIMAGEKVSLKANAFSRSGFTFVGWSTSSYASTATYDDESEVSFSYNTTLYAVWKAGVTITFNGNGGVTYDNETRISLFAEYNSSTGNYVYTLPNNTFIKAGYIFIGWSQNNYYSSSSKIYDSGQKINSDTAITFYAIWVSDTMTIKYNVGSGSISQTSQNVKLTKNDIATGKVLATVINTKPVRNDYIFTGWSTKSYNQGDTADCVSGKQYNFVITISSTGKVSDFNLYAMWGQAKITLSYYMYDISGTSKPANQTYIYNESDLEVQTGVDGKTYYSAKPVQFTVSSLLPSNITGSDGEIVCFYAWTKMDMSAPSGQFKYTHTFASADSHSVIAPNDTITITKDTTLYPVYISFSATDGYKITYDNNSDGVNDHRAYYVIRKNSDGKGVVYTLLKKDSSWKHGVFGTYDFMGWQISGDTTYTTHHSGTTIIITKDTTLYAVWD